MLISKAYLFEQRRLHTLGGYGVHGGRWAKIVRDIWFEFNGRTILDYGCGGGDLASRMSQLGIKIREYDPAVEGKNDRPKPSDIVVCTDVLEHIEPTCLEPVLNDLRRLTLKALFVVISTREAGKSLSDGSNAHLIVRNYKWWQQKLKSHDFLIHNRFRPEPDSWASTLIPGG